MRLLLVIAVSVVAAAQVAIMPGSISGKVVNALTGDPLSGAQLRLDRTGSPAFFTAETGDDGSFTAVRLEPGEYHIRVDRPGFIGIAKPYPVVLDPAKGATGINFSLQPHGIITGRVLDAEGEPLVGAGLRLQRRGYVDGQRKWAAATWTMGTSSSPVVHTDDRGVYRVYGLPPGVYAIQITGFGQQQAPTFEITPGLVIQNADIRLTPVIRLTLRGRVENRSGKTGNMSVSAISEDRVGVGFAAVNPQGEFVVESLTPGRYWVTAYLNADRGVRSRMPLDLRTGSLDGMTLRIDPPVTVEGKVTIEASPTPASFTGLELELKLSTPPTSPEPRITMKVQPDGAFQIGGVSSDQYDLLVAGIPTHLYLQSARAGDLDLMRTSFRPGSGPIEITLASGAPTLTGMTTPGAKVVLVPNNKLRSLYRTVDADHEGRFTMTGLTPGDYKIFAWTEVEETAWLDPEFLAPIEDKGTPVTLERSKQARVNVVALN